MCGYFFILCGLFARLSLLRFLLCRDDLTCLKCLANPHAFVEFVSLNRSPLRSCLSLSAMVQVGIAGTVVNFFLLFFQHSRLPLLASYCRLLCKRALLKVLDANTALSSLAARVCQPSTHLQRGLVGSVVLARESHTVVHNTSFLVLDVQSDI